MKERPLNALQLNLFVRELCVYSEINSRASLCSLALYQHRRIRVFSRESSVVVYFYSYATRVFRNANAK